MNLLSNAIKFAADTDGYVDMSADYDRQTAARIRALVSIPHRAQSRDASPAKAEDDRASACCSRCVERWYVSL